MAHRNVANGTGPRQQQRRRGGTGSAWMAAGTTTAVACGLLLASLLTPTTAGAGGGDQLWPVSGRYEPGQHVTLVGYTEPVSHDWGDGSGDPDRQGWAARQPYYAYLRVDPRAAEGRPPRDVHAWPYVHSTDLRVGQVVAEVRPDVNDRRSLRAQVDFRLPDDLAAGPYDVIVCNDPCTTGLGWFVDDSKVYVGVDPPLDVALDWPLDDPAIAGLEDDRLLIDPAYSGAYGDSVDDWTVTAAEVRSGYRPTLPPTTVPPPTAPAVARAGVPDGDGGVLAEADRNLRTGAETDGGLSGEVIAWVAGFGVLLVVWCAGWRLRPRGARIVVRQSDDPRHPPSDTAVDPEPVRIEL